MDHSSCLLEALETVKQTGKTVVVSAKIAGFLEWGFYF
jgi:hypothetical protein